MEQPVRFFLPGPTWVPEEVLAAMTRQPVGHRSSEFMELYGSLSDRLKRVFRTSRDVVTVTSSGSLCWDIALASTAPTEVLCLTNGAFSERFLTAAKSRGLSVDQIAVPWGQTFDPALLRDALRRKRYQAVTLAHNETSTGVLSPLAELAEVVHAESDALLFVDAVSSLAGAELEPEPWGIDFLFTGAQKALALPPGLAFFTVSERFEARAAEVEHRGFYTDALRYLEKHRGGSTVTTPAVCTFFALDVQLDRILAEGMEARWQRHLAMRRRTEEWVAGNDFTYGSSADAPSPTVSCVKPPEEIEAPALVKALKARGVTVGGGYGKWKPTSLRIGHMGEVGLDDLEALLSTIDDVVAAGV